MTIRALIEEYKRNGISCVELTHEVLGLAIQNRFNALVHIAEESAQGAAQKIDERIKAYESCGRGKCGAFGLPIAIKDNIAVDNMPLTCASAAFKDFSTFDADVVKKLKNAGVVILGKTNMDEFAMGVSGETSCFGASKNPYDPTLTAGGSSGGSASVVASGECFASLGTDTGGSVRLPAAFCGIVGYKPTFNLISNSGIVPCADSFDQVGIFAQNVQDLQYLLNTMTNIDMQKHQKFDIKGKKIGIIKEFFDVSIESELATRFEDTLGILEKMGAKLVEVSLPFDTAELYRIVSRSEIAKNMANYSGYGNEVRLRVEEGERLLKEGHIVDAAKRERARLEEYLQNLFLNIDAIVSPTTPAPAFKLGSKITRDFDVFLRFANLAYLPAVSVPLKTSGKPQGFHIVCNKFFDSQLLAFAQAVEASQI